MNTGRRSAFFAREPIQLARVSGIVAWRSRRNRRGLETLAMKGGCEL
jgi:hypothetical protein